MRALLRVIRRLLCRHRWIDVGQPVVLGPAKVRRLQLCRRCRKVRLFVNENEYTPDEGRS